MFTAPKEARIGDCTSVSSVQHRPLAPTNNSLYLPRPRPATCTAGLPKSLARLVKQKNGVLLTRDQEISRRLQKGRCAFQCFLLLNVSSPSPLGLRQQMVLKRIALEARLFTININTVTCVRAALSGRAH